MTGSLTEDEIELGNIKDDVVLIQFKLVKRDTLKVLNTLSFINMAESKIHDVNLRILNEITCRLNESASHLNNEFLPYNKSILTRIVYDQIKKNNVLVIVHLSKKALNKYLK